MYKRQDHDHGRRVGRGRGTDRGQRGRHGLALAGGGLGPGQQPVAAGQDGHGEEEGAGTEVEGDAQVGGVGELSGDVGRQAAADEAQEAVRGGGHRALDRGDEHDGLGGEGVVDADEGAADDDRDDHGGGVADPGGYDGHDDGEAEQVGVEDGRGAVAGLEARGEEDAEGGDQQAPGGEDQAEFVGVQLHGVRGVPEHGEEAPVVQQGHDAHGEQSAMAQCPQRGQG